MHCLFLLLSTQNPLTPLITSSATHRSMAGTMPSCCCPVGPLFKYFLDRSLKDLGEGSHRTITNIFQSLVASPNQLSIESSYSVLSDVMLVFISGICLQNGRHKMAATLSWFDKQLITLTVITTLISHVCVQH